MAHMKTHKLVRDKIPDIIRADGRKPIVSVVSGRSLADALNNKLVEEHQEFLAAADDRKKLEELADLLEVIFGLANQIGASKEELFKACDEKRSVRGGFMQGLFLEGYE